MPTKEQKDEYARMARLGCILCRQHGIETTDTPTEIHHVRRFGGKRDLAPAVPLCAYHHRLGDTSIHSLGAKGFSKYWGFTPEELIEKTRDLLDDLL